MALQYKVSGIPAFYIVGKDGTVLYSSIGYGDGKEREFERIILKHGECDGA